jgi:hypothetical protein
MLRVFLACLVRRALTFVCVLYRRLPQNTGYVLSNHIEAGTKSEFQNAYQDEPGARMTVFEQRIKEEQNGCPRLWKNRLLRKMISASSEPTRLSFWELPPPALCGISILRAPCLTLESPRNLDTH